MRRGMPSACAMALCDMRRTARSVTRVLSEYGIFKPFCLLIRERMASSGFDCGVVVAVELHAQLNAFPAAFQTMPIGVA